MKVKVGNKVYDHVDQPIMVQLTDQDKKNIANMHPECNVYCIFDEKKHNKDESIELMSDFKTSKNEKG